MTDILPNWHPVFVHFTVGVLLLSTILYVVGRAFNNQTILNVAKWNLWLGVGISAATVIAGWLAMKETAPAIGSAIGDVQSEMEEHMLWAFTTAVIFGMLLMWSLISQRYKQNISWLFVLGMVTGAGMLVMTGLQGEQLVYQHGVGVAAVSSPVENIDHKGLAQATEDEFLMPGMAEEKPSREEQAAIRLIPLKDQAGE